MSQGQLRTKPKKTRLALLNSYIPFFFLPALGNDTEAGTAGLGLLLLRKITWISRFPVFKELWIVISSQTSPWVGWGRGEWETTKKRKSYFLLFPSKEILRRSLGRSRGERRQNFLNKTFYIFLSKREINILKSIFDSNFCFHTKFIFQNCLVIYANL